MESTYPLLPVKSAKEKLTQIARKQLWTSFNYKKERLGKFQKPIDLLFGKTERKLRQQFNVPLPILSGLYETVCADLDDPVVITYKAGKASDYFAVEKANAAWKVISQDMGSHARWAYKDRMSRKQAILYGRGILKYFSEGKPYRSYLDVVDFPDFIFQPDGGGNLENHLFCGENGIQKTRADLRQGVESGIYNRDAVEAMLSKISPDSEYAKSMSSTDRDRYQRFYAVGLDPDSESYTGDVVFNLSEVYMTYAGRRYYLLFDPWSGECIRMEYLEDIQSNDLYPYVTYATHEDNKNFWSTAIVPDILFPASDAIVTLFNQQLTNNQKQNLNARGYDKDMVKNVAKLDEAQYRADALIPIDTIGGSRDINKAVVSYPTPPIGNTVDLITWVEQMLGKQAGVVQDLPNAAQKGKTNAIVYAEIQQLTKRVDYRSHSYTEAWSDLARRVLDGWKDNLTEPLAIDLIGPDGYMMHDYLKRSDLKKLGTPTITITSTKQQAQEDAMRKQQKVQAIEMLAKDPTTNALLNPKKKAETILRDIGGWNDGEIEEWFDIKNFYGNDLLAKADIALDMLLKNKMPEPVYDANLAFITKLRDFERSHHENLPKKTSTMILKYVMSLMPIVNENMMRLAKEQKANQPGQSSAPQAKPAMPSQSPQRMPQQIAPQPSAQTPAVNPIQSIK
jgi:hypothetical protein